MSLTQRRSRNTTQRLYPSLSGVDTSSSDSNTSEEHSTDESPENSHSSSSQSFTKRRQKITKTILAHLTQSPRPRSRSKSRAKPLASSSASWADNFHELHDQIMKAYLENVGEPVYHFWRNLKPYQKAGLILLLLLSMAAFIVISISLLSTHKRAPKIESFLTDAGATAKRYFANSKKINSLFRYSGNVLLSNQENKSPVILLLVGRENDTSHFLSQFKKLMKRHEQKWEFLDYPISAESPPSRRELETAIFEHLKQSRVLILRGIDHLKSTTPLVLQSITDPESSPFKNTLILATLSPQKEVEKERDSTEYKQCDEIVVSHLLEQWSRGLTADKIHPILSRLSAITHCFD